MTVFNAAVTVVELVEAETPSDAVFLLTRKLQASGFEALENTGDAFESEPLSADVEPLRQEDVASAELARGTLAAQHNELDYPQLTVPVSTAPPTAVLEAVTQLSAALQPGPFQHMSGWTHAIPPKHLANLRTVLSYLRDDPAGS